MFEVDRSCQGLFGLLIPFFPQNLYVNLTINVFWVGRPKNWDRGPNLKFSPCGQSGQKPDFQEYPGGRTKMVFARPFFDSIDPVFWQMKWALFEAQLRIP